MADKEFEPDDPLAPVAVMLETPGHDGSDLMARCFVEEFALMGWPPEKVFRLFTIPEYAASHSVYLERGPAYVKSVIAEVFGHDFEVEQPVTSARTLPVLKRLGAEGEHDAAGS